MKKIALSVLIALTAISAQAEEFQKNGFLYRTTSGNTCAIESGYELTGDVTIFYTVSYGGTDYTITEIDEEAFASNHKITSVKINAPIHTIGKYAFYGCSKLKKVELNDALTTIGDCAFFFCNLEEVTIPKSVTSIGFEAFFQPKIVYINSNAILSKNYYNEEYNVLDMFCARGTSIKIVIGEGIESIGNAAFKDDYSSNLKDGDEWDKYAKSKLYVLFPSTLKEIDGNAFYGTRIVNLELPEGLKSIGNDAFGFCKILTAITIPSTLETCNQFAFYSSEGIVTIYANSTNLESYTGLMKAEYNKKIADVYAKDKDVYNTISPYQSDLGNISIVGQQASTTLSEDVNGDGQVNSLDALKVYKYMQMH